MENTNWRKCLGGLLILGLAPVQSGFAQIEGVAEPQPTDTVAAEAAPTEPVSAETPFAEPAAPAEAAPEVAEAPVAEAPVAEAPVEAQEEASTAAAGPKSRMIEEVVVTAQKREQNLQEVPSSVQAFSGTQLEAQGVSDLKDMQLVTPGLTFDSMASYSIIFIRGVGGDSFQAAVDSSVATYIDGLYLPFTFSSAQALGDVKQVEVLKGPQGTLYGRNAIAGAILVKMKEPGNTYAADFLQQFGNYNDTKTKAAFSGPLPFWEDVKFSVSGLYENRDAFSVNFVHPDRDYIPYRNIGFRAALVWDILDDLKLSGSYYYVRQQDADSVATVLLKSSLALNVATTAHNVPHETGNHPGVGVRAKTQILSFVLDSQLVDWWDNKLVYGHTTAHSDIYFDFDSAPEPILDISALPNTAEADSVELIFNSNPATAPEWLQWTAGLYWEDSYKTGRYPITVDALAVGIGVVDALIPGANGQPVICNALTVVGLDCTDMPSTNKNILVQLPLTSGIQTDHYSAYGQLTFSLTENLQAVAGGRVSTEKRALEYSKVEARIIDVPLVGSSDPIALTAISYKPQDHTWRAFTPNAGLNWKVTPDILTYYKYSEAFKSGNYNGLNVNLPPKRIEPERASSHELGFKSEWLDDRSIKLNGALFTTHVENAQVQILALLSGGVTSLQNAAAYTVQGGELEANWFASESLVFTLTGVYLDGKYDSFIGQGFDPVTGLNFLNNDFSGNDTVRTPKYTATAAVNYTFPLFFGLEGELGADTYYNDGFFYDPLNTLTQESYQIYNARLGVFDPRTNIRVTFFGKNLTDEAFFTQKYRFDFGDTGIWGAARTYGVTFTWAYK